MATRWQSQLRLAADGRAADRPGCEIHIGKSTLLLGSSGFLVLLLLARHTRTLVAVLGTLVAQHTERVDIPLLGGDGARRLGHDTSRDRESGRGVAGDVQALDVGRLRNPRTGKSRSRQSLESDTIC